MKPRPPILFTAAYGAGLATGLLHFGGPLGVAGVTLALTLCGRPVALVTAGAAVTGRIQGELVRAGDHRHCGAGWPDGRVRVRVRVREPVDSSGGPVTLRPLAGCGGTVGARWPAGLPVEAGAEALVTGRWILRPERSGRADGLLVVTEVGAIRNAASPADRLRNGLSHASRQLFGTRAGVVDALVLGSRAGIAPELQESFARSGLIHLLSISGFHVGLVTAWVYLIARVLKARRERALGWAALVGTAYVAFLGWPAPATRAAALALLAARCRVRQRHVDPDALLSATCLSVLLVDPRAVLDLGGWLSATALWGASRFTRWSDRALRPDFWCRTAASSVGATLATAPITAAALGTVAPVGIGLNFAAIPLAAVAVPGVLASLLLYPAWHAGASALAAGSGLCLHLLELLALAGARVPGGHLLTEPGPWSALPWVGGLALAMWATGTRNTALEAARRIGWAGAGLLWVRLGMAGVPGSADGGGGLALHFLDVGQGDAAVLRTPGGRWVVVDGGPAGERFDAGRRVVVPFLERHGARDLAAVVVSHAHLDHIGGVPAVLARFQVGEVLEPGAPVADPLYTGFLTTLDRTRVAWHPVRRGEAFTLDGVRFSVLHPEPDWPEWGQDVNEDSVVLLVEYGGFQALFAGDAGFPAEAELRGRVGSVDLLKVGHHGSRGSTGDEWLDSLRARVAVISVGRNDYGHPAPEALARLKAHRVLVLRTDLDGTISVTTDGSRMRVRSTRETVELGVR